MMKNNQPNDRIYLKGRECRVEYIQIWGSDWFDIALWDAKTEELVGIYTRNLPSVPLAAQQALVQQEHVELLEEAGIVRPTGEVIESKRYGNLCKCDVPNGPTHLAWEWDDSPRKVAERESLVKDEPDLDIER